MGFGGVSVAIDPVDGEFFHAATKLDNSPITRLITCGATGAELAVPTSFTRDA
jgi:hypothetical protein